MAKDDKIWRALVNSLPELNEGESAPDIEAIPKKRVGPNKFFVTKIITEVYVYTDVRKHQFSEATFQNLVILGEMSEAKLKKLLEAEALRKDRNVDTE